MDNFGLFMLAFLKDFHEKNYPYHYDGNLKSSIPYLSDCKRS